MLCKLRGSKREAVAALGNDEGTVQSSVKIGSLMMKLQNNVLIIGLAAVH